MGTSSVPLALFDTAASTVTIGTSASGTESRRTTLAMNNVTQEFIPSDPTIVGGIKDTSLLDGAQSVTVAGRYAYVANVLDDSLRIIDVSDPTSPTIVGGIKDTSLLDGAYSVTVAGRYAYVANVLDDSLRIIDVSDPTSPTIVGGIKDTSLLDGAQSVTVAGRYAYVANVLDDSLRIIDLGGIDTPTANIGSLLATNIDTDRAQINQQLSVTGGATIGTDALVGGALTITGTASSTLFAGNTNPSLIVASGNVGIGTTTPTSRLTVAGDVYITGALRDSTNSAGTTGYVLQTTGSGTQWVATSSLGFGSAITFGTDNQIPFMNSGGTDYDYSSNFTFDGTSLGIGTSTPQSLLTLQSAGTGNETLGLSQFHTLSPTVASTVSFGNELNITNAPTADNALLGSIIRITDNSTTSNIVRGIEIQTDVGLNTLGENTAVSAFARTLGVRGVTTADAGAFYEPAGLYGETEGTTQGNAIRGYSSSITTADLLTLYHDTSDFAGSGLVMNFANSSGSFNATSSQFLNLQNNNVTQFSVSARGTTTIGDGTTNNMAGLQIGYGGICVDNDGSCVASTTGNITSVSSSLGNSDVAELYFSSQELQPGELVVSDGFLSVSRAKKGADGLILGVVSTKPGLTLGYDDNSGVDNEKGYPLALAGRVPVRLSNENGVINQGDPLTLSSVPGVAMKAGSTDTFVGFALEAFDGTRAYSKGYVNQFGDDMVAPVLQNQAAATKVNKPCYFSGGAAVGETSDCDDDYVPISPDVQNDNQVATFNESQAALEQLLLEPATLIEINDGQTVAVGQVTMFVNRGTHFDDETRTALSQLVSTSTDDITKSTGGLSTVWERIRALAQSFVDGILHIAGIDVDRVDTKELCVDGVCITADDLRALINQSDSVPSTTGQQTDVERNVDPADESPGEPEADVDADAGAGDENSTDIPEETVPNQATGTTDTVIDDAADAVEGVDAPVDEGQSGVDTSSVESLEADVATGTPPTDSKPDVAAAPAADQDSAPIVNDSADTELTTIETETETETEIVPEPIEPAESTPESSSAEITTN